MLFKKTFVKLPSRSKGRIFLVGDVHGQGALLRCALRAVAFDEAVDRVVALGDLIDRGPDSEVLLHAVRTSNWFLSILGNHEAMLAQSENWQVNRAWRTDREHWAYRFDERRLQPLIQTARSLPLMMEISLRDGRRVGLVHAEVPPGKGWGDLDRLNITGMQALDTWADSDATSLIWGRRRVLAWARLRRAGPTMSAMEAVDTWDALQPVEGIDLIFSGHSVLSEGIPVNSARNVYHIDTGAFLDGGRLTIVDPLHMVYWQVANRQGRPELLSRDPLPLPPPASQRELMLEPSLDARAQAEKERTESNAELSKILRMLT